MQSWASEELKDAALPDKRLNQRLIKIVENLAQQPEASVPQASGDWAATKATYNFWKSKRIEAEDIISPHQKQTAQRASKEKIILAIIENLQLETAQRIKKALATYAIVAWRLLSITYQARQHPELPCDTVLEAHEWQSLYCHFHGVTQTDYKPPSLRQAVIWIAQLGGFLARRHDGLPGVKTLWRGLRRLHDIASTWKLLHSPPVNTF
jgi:hypothetical protein